MEKLETKMEQSRNREVVQFGVIIVQESKIFENFWNYINFFPHLNVLWVNGLNVLWVLIWLDITTIEDVNSNIWLLKIVLYGS